MERSSSKSSALWWPSAARIENSTFARYHAWLEQHRALRFSGYRDAWEWSTTEIEAFWSSLAEFFEIRFSHPPSRVLEERRMPGARWFPGAELNYAEHAFRHARGSQPAILFQSELRPLSTLAWNELRPRVASVADALREMGIARGDRVAALLPNAPEAVIAMLACASIGAIWSSCSPDFGADGVLERLRQIEPKLLIAVDGYAHAGRRFDRRDVAVELRRALPSLEQAVLVPHLDAGARLDGFRAWPSLLNRDAEPRFEPVPFEHPLWILFSSGTTGAPKAIVHGHGGILLEHLKSIALQNDMKPGDRFFWHTTTGWMMWNLLVGGLLAGCTIVLYDGSPSHPDLGVLWRLAQDARVTRFGASASWFSACMRAGIEPGRRYDLSELRAVGSTGSPLPPEAFEWVYDAVKRDVWLASSSGGTDVCSAFLCGCPMEPVYAGELQGPSLGARIEAFDDDGQRVIGQEGELVIREPMPSMPLFFWNDPGGGRYCESYFDTWPGVWRHGDRITITPRGGAVIHGRSDATLNRHGVRIGTGEIYRAVESMPEVADSLVVGVERPGGGYWMPLFVALRDGVVLDDALRDLIRRRIRDAFSPRHVPDEILQVAEVPRTLNGKKLEVPVKRILAGEALERVVNPASVLNPGALGFFVELARRRAG